MARTHLAVLFAAAAAILQAGCARQRTLPVHFTTCPPTTSLVLFSDGFHSGAILAQRDFPLIIRHRGPLGDVDSGTAPWVEIGYSEHDWILGIDRGAWHVTRLCFVPADGLVFVRLLPTPERAPGDLAPRLLVRVPLTERAMERVRARIVAWTDLDQLGYAAVTSGDAVMARSTRSYSVWRNCHDFTAELTAELGLPTATAPLRLPGSNADDLKAAAELVAMPGFTAVDVPPAVP